MHPMVTLFGTILLCSIVGLLVGGIYGLLPGMLVGVLGGSLLNRNTRQSEDRIAELEAKVEQLQSESEEG
jgi:uncharacterized membrane-anchored protein YhcB (DUF1043 family)